MRSELIDLGGHLDVAVNIIESVVLHVYKNYCIENFIMFLKTNKEFLVAVKFRLPMHTSFSRRGQQIRDYHISSWNMGVPSELEQFH